MTFQAESKKSGDEFEALVVSDLADRGFENIKKNVYMPGTGCEVDFVAGTEYVEAKGGKDGDGKRPGAKRTDNVKKAIANASLIKCRYPDIYYVVYFSAKPDKDSYSEHMLNTALEFGIVDEVRYLYPSDDFSQLQYLLDIQIHTTEEVWF
jgi:hypothetical protein